MSESSLPILLKAIRERRAAFKSAGVGPLFLLSSFRLVGVDRVAVGCSEFVSDELEVPRVSIVLFVRPTNAAPFAPFDLDSPQQETSQLTR